MKTNSRPDAPMPQPVRIRRWTAALLLGFASSVWAVKPGQWVHQTEADFGAGELTDVIVTNLGDVRLARASEQVAELEGEDSIVYDIEALPDGRVFAAVGPVGKIARLEGGKAHALAEFEGSQVFALSPATEGGLWVAVSGSPSRLELRRGEDMAVARTIELPDVRYVWDVATHGSRLWLATGADGKVLTIDLAQEDARPVVALDTPHTNLLCLGVDGAGRVYAGSDGEGIVYRVSPGDDGGYHAFALYDAPEPEIGALLVLEDGTVFAGTADVEQAKPGRLEQPQAQPVGRVEPPGPGDIREKVPNVPPKPQPQNGEPMDPARAGQPPPAKPGPPAADEAATPAQALSEAPATAQPTPEQYDRLRAAVRQRLEQAMGGGRVEFQAAPMPPAQSGAMPSAGPVVIRSRTGGQPPPNSKKGNAIYRISPDGFVREVFREAVVILRLIGNGRGLYAATGNEGELYYIDADAEEVTLLARLEPKQLPALWRATDGPVMVGTANPGRVLRLKDRYSAAGTLRSATLDASQVSLWGKLSVAASTPEGTGVEVQTRSGNVNNPDDGSWWSDWSAPQPLELHDLRSGYIDVLSPPARYLQYRLTLRSDGDRTPTVMAVSLRYLTPNMRPKITSIKSEYPSKPAADPQPLHTMKITWEAADPNNDKLIYTVEARDASAGEDAPFVTIAKELTPNSYEWDTRTVPDGRYFLRVTASDASDNTADQALDSSRRSDPVVVDNAPPSIDDLEANPAGDGAIELTAEIRDGLTPVSEVRYRVGGSEEWVLVLPADLIYDSTLERISVNIRGLSPETVNVSLRATDALGNTRYASQTVTIR